MSSRPFFKGRLGGGSLNTGSGASEQLAPPTQLCPAQLSSWTQTDQPARPGFITLLLVQYCCGWAGPWTALSSPPQTVLFILETHFMWILLSACRFPQKKPAGILLELNLQICLGRIANLTVLSHPVLEHGISLHLFRSSLISLNNVLSSSVI